VKLTIQMALSTSRAPFLTRHSSLVVDQIGYLPVGSTGGNAVVTIALLDRLLDHAVVIASKAIGIPCASMPIWFRYTG
jgi:hypothetical protein